MTVVESKVDPRILKTRKKLKEAFLELLSNKNINEINVKDLTTKASVTRGTFYLHFKDKSVFTDEMMTQFIEDLLTDSLIQDEHGISKFSLNNFLNHVEAQPELLLTLLKDKAALAYRSEFEDNLFRCINDYRTKINAPELSVPKSVLMNYLMYTFLGYVDGWLGEGKMYATHFMATTLGKILDSELIQEADLTGFFIY
ncbi:TetR/AcrR family transcriptional regulator [Vagococcus xieshaowenii]|uniref:TetR/AcrR family transcriptional regulator n=1 Tax=Vagococcus xieshaowenii TaxID=2562451 RepID=A0A4Z0DBW0_9ENTE|nr:TetR/AcrR family transcriptional regulator [Vagococcus xieshaowenii]QCA28297.1 TetR/AcrR family transcriptional regulator [Vagococcus xieshaowenii]TFZ42315.1 TetR/AcrR family transcriptional regulator [Vagococcus xieshaowenii]